MLKSKIERLESKLPNAKTEIVIAYHFSDNTVQITRNGKNYNYTSLEYQEFLKGYKGKIVDVEFP